jgi:hypothetical protein
VREQNCMQVLVGEPKGKRPFARPRHGSDTAEHRDERLAF